MTTGEWQVDRKGLWIDEAKSNVYFSATYDTWTEQHLYVAPIPSVAEMSHFLACAAPKRLTGSDMTHSGMTVSSDFCFLVSCHSSLNSPPALTITAVEDLSTTATIALHAYQSPVPSVFRNLITPQLIAIPNKSGVRLQTAYYPPATIPEDGRKSVPLVVLVYGGTAIQQVVNDYKLVCQPRLQMLCHYGYACCMIDNQGSSGRGNAFEASVKHKLGQLEVQDQVDVIEELGKLHPYLDLSRVAVYGWSYGGYIALMCLGSRPDFFKLALAGAPVVDWNLYNSAYTERYLGTPNVNPEGYEKGKITSYVSSFPSERDRVILFHGMSDENVHFAHTLTLIQALVKNSKPYKLQLYPSERHGLKSTEATFHHEQVCLISLMRITNISFSKINK